MLSDVVCTTVHTLTVISLLVDELAELAKLTAIKSPGIGFIQKSKAKSKAKVKFKAWFRFWMSKLFNLYL
jgi:hypothetical protein